MSVLCQRILLKRFVVVVRLFYPASGIKSTHCEYGQEAYQMKGLELVDQKY